MRGLGIFATVIAVLVGWVMLGRKQPRSAPPSAPVDVLQAVPADTILALRVDVSQLRDSSIGAALLGQGRAAAGFGPIQQLCGHDPLDTIEQVALVLPARNDVGFGIFARGTFQQQTLLACAEKVLQQRQGRPVTQRRGDYQVLRDVTTKVGAAQLAVAEGLLLVAEPSYLGDVIDNHNRADAGRSIRDNPQHAALRDAVGPAAVTATAVLSDALRATLRDELRAQKMVRSPFASIRAAAASLRLGDDLQLHLVLRCDSPAPCTAAADMLDRVRRDEARSSRAGYLGLSQVLATATVQARASDVHVRARLEHQTARAVLEKLVRLQRLSALFAAPPPPASPAPPTTAANSGAAASDSANRGTKH